MRRATRVLVLVVIFASVGGAISPREHDVVVHRASRLAADEPDTNVVDVAALALIPRRALQSHAHRRGRALLSDESRVCQVIAASTVCGLHTAAETCASSTSHAHCAWDHRVHTCALLANETEQVLGFHRTPPTFVRDR